MSKISSIILVITCTFTTVLSAKFIKLATIDRIDDKKNISFFIPCGAKYTGLVIIENKNKLTLAVSYKQSKIHCLTGDKLQVKNIAYLVSLKKISFLNRKTIKVLNQSLIKTKAVVSNSHSKKSPYSRFSFAYKKQCEHVFATNYSSHSNSIKVSLLSIIKRKNRKKSCPSKIALLKQNYVQITTSKSIVIKNRAIYQSKSKDYIKKYNIVVNKVVDESIVKNSNNSLSLKYYHKCNEAPVGIALRKTKSRKYSVSIVSAQYSNLECNKKKTLISKYKTNKLDLNYIKNSSFVSTTYLKQAVYLDNVFKQTKSSIIAFNNKCHQTSAIVLATDTNLNSAIAFLRFKNKQVSCSQAKLATKKYSLAFVKNKKTKLYPLILPKI